MRYSIKRRLLVGLLFLALVISTISSLIIYYETELEVGNLFDAQIEQAAKMLLELSSHEIYEQIAFVEGGDHAHHGTFAIPDNEYGQWLDFQIWILGNRLAVRSSNAPETPLTDKEKEFSDVVLANGNKYRVYAISSDDQSLQIQIMADYNDRNRLTNTISIHYLTALGIILPLIALLITLSVGSAFSPLERIARDLENRRPDEFDKLDIKNIPVEVETMVGALNHLFSRVQVAFDNIKRFTADAAHELRTPLAVMKVNSQIALKSESEQTRREAVQDMHSEVDRTTSLVEQLLMLSRLDAKSTSEHQKVNIKALVELVVIEFDTMLERKHIELELHVGDGVFVEGNPELLLVMLRNLLRNAIAYTPHGGKVLLQAQRLADGVCVCVEDSGPGIKASEYDQVFKRFYRSVEHSDLAKGTGLGLSIVQRVLELHKASIELAASDLGGLKVEVVFPV